MEAAQDRAERTFVGRADEMAALLRLVEEGGPLVAVVHGIAGIGKSTLLAAFGRLLHERGIAVVSLDCSAFEPTERGFLAECRRALGVSDGDPVEMLGQRASRTVLQIDTYEAFRISDAWLRRTFLPAVPANVRVVLAGRDAPSLQWFGPLGWTGAIVAIELGPLDDPAASELLGRSGVPNAQVATLKRIARGHPLALRVAAATAISGTSAPPSEEEVARSVIFDVARRYVDRSDHVARRALEAASVVRRATLPLLRAMLGDPDPTETFRRLASLPFAQETRDGLAIHETVQQAISTLLRSEDPERHRGYRQAAWRQLASEMRAAGAPDLWRLTADMIFLIDNPIVREAFFPVGGQPHSVEPARDDDGPAILETIARHEPAQAGAILQEWWVRAPETFRAVRDRDGQVAGFYQVFEMRTVPEPRWPKDPIVARWREHARSGIRDREAQVLFLRRQLDRERGEAPGSVQAAVWLDVKRLYIEMRPRLQRVYATVTAPTAKLFAPALEPLYFLPVPELLTRLDGQEYATSLLDFGPGSIDDWLARVAARELGIPRDELLDLGARELVTDGARVPLTRLEFALLRYLMEREGKVVARADLLQDVWGYSYEGDSNVVEVAIRALRRKLGERSRAIVTVRGAGYRYRSLT